MARPSHIFTICSFVIGVLISISGVSQEFAEYQNLSNTSHGVTDAVAVDVDDDGDLDIILSARYDDLIALHLNEGSTYSDRIILSQETYDVRDILLADIDADGDDDIVSLGSGLHLLRNNGNGEFIMDGVFWEVQGEKLQTADMDGDGDMDLIASSNDDESFFYLINNGIGDFLLSQEVVVGDEDGMDIQLGDMDEDGDIDVVVHMEEAADIVYYQNDGGVLLEDAQPINLGISAMDFKVVDVNNDGHLDIVSGRLDRIRTIYGYGDGMFSDDEVHIVEAPDIRMIRTVDWDFDGDIDILISSGSDLGIYLVDNDEFEFGPATQIGQRVHLEYEGVFEVLDSGGDGDLDILSNFNDHVHWFENIGSEELIHGPQINSGVSSVRSIDTGDVDGDGDKDIIACSWGDRNISVYWNSGEGDFSDNDIVGTGFYGAKDADLVDVDGDNDLDIISVGDSVGFYLLFNNGLGEFAPPIHFPAEDYSWSIDFGDFNGDGHIDVATCSFWDGLVSWFENDGTGMFGTAQSIFATENTGLFVRVADIDGDGDDDVVYSSKQFSQLMWHENLGQGGEWEPHYLHWQPTQFYAEDVAIVDFDQDGDLDLVFPLFASDEVSLFMNEGNGEFTEEIQLAEWDNEVNGVELADFNDDGLIDVVVHRFSSLGVDHPIDMIPNNGDGTFSESQLLLESLGIVTSMKVDDMDADGDSDLIEGVIASDEIIFRENITGEGCTAPDACNFDPESWNDDGSCCFNCGCDLPWALNYDSDACLNDGSCQFLVTGRVIYDQNGNGVDDPEDIGIASHTVASNATGQLAITDSDGNFQLTVSASDQYSFSTQGSDAYPFNTTPWIQTYEAGEENWNQNILFGLDEDVPEVLFELDLDSWAGLGYPCDLDVFHYVTVSNVGNGRLSAIVRFQFDDLFLGYNELTPIDSSSVDGVYFSIDSLNPGENSMLNIELHTPTADFLGSMIATSAIATIFLNGIEVETDTIAMTKELTCAYDPNDKQVFPAGYTDAHYVPEEEYLEYLVRFQNTGNAPATDVIIRDTIDDGLDLSTFQLVANSHSVFTTVDPQSREVEFYFQNIMLPDSVNNEPESHGLVSYKIRPEEELPLLTELNNTAYIFFDNNPPIVTNTTWSTLYDCSLFEVSFTDNGAILTASEGDSYQWYLDGEPIEGATFQIFEAFENGEYAVEISNDFPCSELTGSVFVLVDALEEIGDSPIALFPNPMTTTAILDLGELRGDFTLEIFDVAGKVVRTWRAPSGVEGSALAIERGDLRPGQYILRLSKIGESHELPFVINQDH